MSKAKPIQVRCSCCGGTGTVELNGAYFDTLVEFRKPGGEYSAADLARLMGVAPTAMSNRLSVLERFGLLTSRQYGRKRLFKVVSQPGAV